MYLFISQTFDLHYYNENFCHCLRKSKVRYVRMLIVKQNYFHKNLKYNHISFIHSLIMSFRLWYISEMMSSHVPEGVVIAILAAMSAFLND